MAKTLVDDEKVEALKAIFAQDIPYLPDDWAPPPSDEVEVVPRPTVTIAAVGGRAVVVDEGEFIALLDAAGVPAGPDISRADFGRILTHAKGGNPLMGPLLAVRSELAPLYRVKTTAGRPWRPFPITTAIEPHPEHLTGAAP